MRIGRRTPVFCLLGTLVLCSGTRIGAQVVINAGDILAANYSGGSVLRIDPTSGTQQSLGAFAAPTDLAMDEDGALYVAEWDGDIWRLDLLAGGARTLVNPDSILNQVWGITLGTAGDLYVTSRVGHSIYRIDLQSGAETLVASGDLLAAPTGIELLDAARLVVSSTLGNRLVAVAIGDGAQTEFASGIDHPWGVAVQGSDVYTTGYDSKLISRILEGAAITVASTTAFPYGIDLDADGNIIAGLSGPDQVVQLSPQGTVLNTFSGGNIRQITGVEIATATLSTQDTDGDGVPDWEEEVAGTDPADAASVLRARLLPVDGPPLGVRLEWPSVAGRVYSVLQASGLGASAGDFAVLASGLAATPPWNTYDDTVTGPGPVFYRIDVQRAP